MKITAEEFNQAFFASAEPIDSQHMIGIILVFGAVALFLMAYYQYKAKKAREQIEDELFIGGKI